MKILITGGAGYIGSILVGHLLAAGHDVVVLDNFMYRQQSLNQYCSFPSFSVVCGDARAPAGLRALLTHADVVIPLAAIVGAPACNADAVGAESINKGAVLVALKMMSKDQRILIPITNSGYGIGDPGTVCTEETPLRPISHYGRTKVEAEKAVLDRGNAISFRLATVFGVSPRMRTDLLVNDFVRRAVFDRSIVLFESHFRRNYIHIRDVARAFEHGIENFETMKDRPYNVGLSDANLTKFELCERIKRYTSLEVFESPIGEDPDKRDYVVSNARIESTGFKPMHSLDDGIIELLKGYRMVRSTEHGNA